MNSYVTNETSGRDADRRTERWVSYLLRGGVVVSLSLLLAAMAVSISTQQSWIGTTDLNELLSGGTGLRSDPPRNLAQLNLIQGSILLLILLPGFRVAFLLGSFVRRRDAVFAVIALLVLTFMSIGMLFELRR